MHAPLFIKGGRIRFSGKGIAGQRKLIITAGRVCVDLMFVAHDGTAIYAQPVRFRQPARQRMGKSQKMGDCRKPPGQTGNRVGVFDSDTAKQDK